MTNNYIQSKNMKISKSNIRPYFAYFWYLTKSIFRMYSTWVLLILSLLAGFGINLIPLFYKDSDSSEMFKSIVALCLIGSGTAIILLAGLIGILKTINIFLTSEKDGSEILIISKPITRCQLIFTRFFFLFIFATLYSIVNLILFMINIALLDLVDSAFNSHAIRWGIFFGPFLAFIFMGLFSLVLGLKFSPKTARIVPMLFLFGGIITAKIVIPSLALALYNPDVKIAKNLEEIKTDKYYTFKKLDGESVSADGFKSKQLDDNNKADFRAGNFELSAEQKIISTFNFPVWLKDSKDPNSKIYWNDLFFRKTTINSNKYPKRKLLVLKSGRVLTNRKWKGWDPENDRFKDGDNTASYVPTKKEYESWYKETETTISTNALNLRDMKQEVAKKMSQNNLKGYKLFIALALFDPISTSLSLSGLDSVSPEDIFTNVNNEPKYKQWNPEHNVSYKLAYTKSKSPQDFVLAATDKKKVPSDWLVATIWSSLVIVVTSIVIIVYLRRDFK